VRPLIVEFMGPFALVFVGAGSVMLAAEQGLLAAGGTTLTVALASGLTIAAMIAAAGHISGGHYNPAVTFGLFLGGKIGGVKAAAYILVQLAGAVVAAVFLREIFGPVTADVGVPRVLYEGDFMIIGRQNAFIIEVILTFLLVYVICGTAVDSRGAHTVAPLAIGFVITAEILVAGPLTGAAMNPARHFGPALAQGQWADTWVYWAAPLTGGAIAAILFNYVLIPPGAEEPEARPSEHHDHPR
jgi:aquaporin TIP